MRRVLLIHWNTEEAKERIRDGRDQNRDCRDERRAGRPVGHVCQRDEGYWIAESAYDLRGPEEREVWRAHRATASGIRLRL